ncbi:rhomboid family intramembrane serine protease [Zavarzinella formosa]|uniref:rhomboid family intramembrane serine protease n=1 Tax=Zavarzinella formosa TaxID=360055 RepID=UPI0002DB4E23|nr:rhomboid family intramembrane serine protease [Zavarzinella formosa]
MGIADRDYYREDRRWHNPFARSQVTVFLVVIYLFLFVAQNASLPRRGGMGDINPQGITNLLELNPDLVFKGEVWRVLSYATVHQPENILHVIVTVFFLIWIGRHVEDLYGSREYLALLLFTSLLGGLTFTAISAISPQFMGVLRGPSATVTALFVLYVLHYPGRMLHQMLPLPLWFMLIGYAVQDIVYQDSNSVKAGILGVHLASACFAFSYHRLSWRILNWLPSSANAKARSRRSNSKLRIFQERPEPKPEPATASVGTGGMNSSSSAGSGLDEHLEAKLDEVLDKVNKTGKASLTESEQQVLLRASEIYKKRRQST